MKCRAHLEASQRTQWNRGDNAYCGEAWGVRGQGKGTRVGKGGMRAKTLSLSQVRRVPPAEGSHALGCYNPVIEDTISYATLRFPVGETDMPRIGY